VPRRKNAEGKAASLRLLLDHLVVPAVI
jgi:hypothetical protein